MSKVLAILSAAYQAISTPPIADVACYRHRPFAPPRDNQLATVNVKIGRESPPSLKTGPSTHTGVADRTTELLVIIVARGETALEEVERLRIEVRKRLMADHTLGGICYDIEDAGAQRHDADVDGAMEQVIPIFHVKYRTIGEET